MNHLDSPIIVTGCARSGTSLIAGIIAQCGAWTGKVTGATTWNRKGQFENEVIRDQITKPYLKSIGADPLGQDPLPVIEYLTPDPMWRQRVEKAIKAQGYDGSNPWMFKGAKACLIWPLWVDAFPQATWVIVRREDSKIIDSCMKTHFMRKRKTRESWREWVDHHKKCFDQIRNTVDPDRYWEISSGEIVSGVGEWKLAQLVQEVGLTWDEEKIGNFIDCKLWSGG